MQDPSIFQVFEKGPSAAQFEFRFIVAGVHCILKLSSCIQAMFAQFLNICLAKFELIVVFAICIKA